MSMKPGQPGAINFGSCEKLEATTMEDHERINQIYAIKNLDKHIIEFVNQHEKATTRYNYEYILKKFCKYCQDNGINELRQENAQNIINNYKANLVNTAQLKSSSIDNYMLRVQSFMTHLNLKVKLSKISEDQPGNYKYLTYDEIQQLLASIPATTGNKTQILMYTAIIKVLFTAGLRINELVNLTLEDIKQHNNATFLFIVGKGKAHDQKQAIGISNPTANAINDYLDIRPSNATSNYIFVNTHGQQLTRQTVNKKLKQFARKCDEENGTNIGNKCTSHIFRHSLARYCLIDQQMPISQVRDILRHKSIETTNKYLTNSDDEINQLRAGVVI